MQSKRLPSEPFDHHQTASIRREDTLGISNQQEIVVDMATPYAKYSRRYIMRWCYSSCVYFFWHNHVKPGTTFSTSYSNGVRGLCAVKVHTLHSTRAIILAMTSGYGSFNTDRCRYTLELPHSYGSLLGKYCTYSWCLRPSEKHSAFQFMDKADQAAQAKIFLGVLASQLRRVFRLCLAPACMTLHCGAHISGCFRVYLGYGNTKDYREYFADSGRKVLDPQMASLSTQLTTWWVVFFELTNIWNIKLIYSCLRYAYVVLTI